MDTIPLGILIVDDEPLARVWLKRQLSLLAEPPHQVLAEADDAEAALAALAHGGAAEQADLVLLDIAMPGQDGLRFAHQLRRMPQSPAVVFVTAHAEHALRAFEVEALDYLTKPVTRERLQAALLRVQQRRARPASQEPVLVVSDRGRVLRIPVSEAIYLKAEQKYVTLRTARGQWVLDESLNELEKRLGDAFLRIHRNALVARSAARVLALRPPGEGDEEEADSAGGGHQWALQVSNGEWLAVSRRQVTAVREALSLEPPARAAPRS